MNKEHSDHHRTAAAWLREKREALIKAVVTRIYAEDPATWETFGETGLEKSKRDVGHHLTYLSEALTIADPTLFTEYIAWAKVLFAGLDLPEGALLTTLESIRIVLRERLPEELWLAVLPYLDAGLKRLEHAPTTSPSYLSTKAPLADLAQAYFDALLGEKRHLASCLILDAVEEGVPVKKIYLHVFQPVQREIGRLWQQNRVSVAQEHYCTAATQLVMSQLYRYIFNTTKNGRRLVATCVGGELHEIGVRMVADFFEMEGWDTYYLGANTPAESLLQVIEEQAADMLAISATLMSHVSKVKTLIQQVRMLYPQNALKILVGGYPFNATSELWQRVGADGYAPNAQQAIALANQWVEETVSSQDV